MSSFILRLHDTDVTDTGWRRSSTKLRFGFGWQRWHAAWRLLSRGTLGVELYWVAVGPDPQVWLDDLSVTIGGR